MVTCAKGPYSLWCYHKIGQSGRRSVIGWFLIKRTSCTSGITSTLSVQHSSFAQGRFVVRNGIVSTSKLLFAPREKRICGVGEQGASTFPVRSLLWLLEGHLCPTEEPPPPPPWNTFLTPFLIFTDTFHYSTVQILNVYAYCGGNLAHINCLVGIKSHPNV